MPSNSTRCTVCELPQRVLDEVNLRMISEQNNGTITRWLRENRIEPVPNGRNLNKHRRNEHYLVNNPDGVATVNDSVVGQGHRDGMNVMQRVQMNIAHTVLPRLANIPQQINELEEMQELYVFSKNQLAIEFQNSRLAPEVYVHPVTKEPVLIYPTTTSMLKLIPELRRQLKEMVDTKEKLVRDMDIESEISLKFMEIIKGEGDLQKLISNYLDQSAIQNAIVVQAEPVPASGNGESDESTD